MNAIALYSAVIAVAFSVVRPGWFTLWFDLLLWLETKGWFGAWIAKPLGMCEVCVAGQLALWWSVLTLPHVWASAPTIIINSCVAILLAPIINKTFQWSTS